jgi:hypothetical protein
VEVTDVDAGPAGRQSSRREATRRLAAALEPFAGQVYFSPECHAEYAALGFDPSPLSTGDGVQLPDGPAYFTSRGSALGRASGELVASAFAVFNPAVVVAAVDRGWSLTDAPSIAAARARGATAQLHRVLGEHPAGIDRVGDLLGRAGRRLRPEGRPLYAGVLSLGLPGDSMGDAWRLADRLREFRGDAHTAAWTSAGFDAVEIGLLTELYWGLPLGSYLFTRAWSVDEQQEAKTRLEHRGLIADDAFTDAGRVGREAVEDVTDRQCLPMLDELGEDLAELLDVLEAWGGELRAAGAYLPAGPHDLAGST